MRQRSERSDSRRSREMILRAAAELIAERGAEVPMYEISRRAGVGQGTLYRHFPDRAALVAELFEGPVTELERQAAAAGSDPAAFDQLLTAMVGYQVRTHSLVRALREGHWDAERVSRVTDRVLALFAGPMRAAQDAGLLRPDLNPGDVLMLLAMIEGVLQWTAAPAGREAAADRALSLLRASLAPSPVRPG
jgi:AcrR family transcriptional regulator